ncbi:MAG: TauD/TfdA family dioxygenase [Proteobacteria bacterium]|nr:TauD/TfdA family dioxygenase [Pseudomonadota bacterium]
MATQSQGFKIVPTGASLGADIVGLDIAKGVDADTARAVYKAWNDHLVLRFRGHKLDDDQLAAFSKNFGDLDKAPIAAKDGPTKRHRDDVAVISNIVENGKPIGGLGNSELVWHQDMSYNELPPKASLLYGVETPAEGGETFFYNLYKAYETLPERLKTRIRGLSCKHDATRNSSGGLRNGYDERYSNEKRPGAIHPLVVKHPETGKPSLYLGRRPNAWIVGLSDAESDALLVELWAHVENGPFHWAQEWRQGDLVIWDNRCTLHRRNQLDPRLRRLMHRTQVKDKARPVAA